jgi:hypothetical protein
LSSNWFIVFVLATGLGCTPKPVAQSSSDSVVTVSQILSQHTQEWMKIPGVIGTGEGQKDGKPAILIFVERRSEEIEKKLPKVIGSYPVVIEETGKVKAN